MQKRNLQINLIGNWYYPNQKWLFRSLKKLSSTFFFGKLLISVITAEADYSANSSYVFSNYLKIFVWIFLILILGKRAQKN